ncbi:hypothetical protein KC330_g7139 [Hortaea werneckii]|nr:hypothetical protein KC330_g7139 [Hortaea werneckii]
MSATSQMIVTRHSRPEGAKTVQGPSHWFTGGPVYIDPCHSTSSEDASCTTSCANVTFTPGARTNWHWHEKGQLLKVEMGTGWVCDKGGKPVRISAGDTVWCPPGVVHWHGAGENSAMSHFVFAVGGVEWYDAVTDEEYRAGGGV